MDKQISITAAMRGDGFQKLDQQLAKIEERAKRITQEMGKWGSGIGGKGSYFEHPSAPSSSGAPRGGRRAPSGGSSSAQSYDLNSPTGLINWDENVLSVALPTLESINKASNGSGSGVTTGTTVPRRRSGSGSLSSSMPTSFGNSHLKRFMTAAKGHSSVGGILANGLKGVMGGALGEAIGGGAAGGAGEMLLGGVMGDLIGGPIGAVAAIGGQFVMNSLTKGYSQWQQTAPGVSQLVHSLGQASQGVEQFRVNVLMAGANMAMSLTQSAQAASMLTQSFGNVSEAGITKLVTQTGASALYNGIAPSQMAQIIGSSATAGITSGVGRSMSVGQYTGMLANMTLASHMQGRQASLYQGLTNIYGTLAATNPIISNPNGVAAQYAAMNASGIQGLQGLRGAQLVSQMDQGFASAQGIQQALAFSAIMKASGGKITDPYQIQSLMEQGVAAIIPGTHTTVGAAYASGIRGVSNNKYLQGSLFGMGLNINQAMAVLQHGGLNATGISTNNAQTTPLSLIDKVNIASAVKKAEYSRVGHLQGELKAFPNNILMGIPDAINAKGQKLWYNSNGVPQAPLGSTLNANTNANFISRMAQQAQYVSEKTGVPSTYLLAQWAMESANGSSIAAAWNNNFAGIKPFGKYLAGQDVKYAGFSSLHQFAQADVQVLNSARYRNAISNVKSMSPQQFFETLSKDGYGGKTPAQYWDAISGYLTQQGTTSSAAKIATKGGSDITINPTSIREFANEVGKAIIKYGRAGTVR